jgi:site-specific DNA-methyltransferase (adenine-specific)
MTTATQTPRLAENRERGSHSLQRLVGRHSWALLINGDCLDVLPTVEAVQAVITDPPYGTGKLCTNGASYKVKPKRENYDWDTWGEAWIDAVQSDCKLIFTPPKQLATMLQRDGARLLCAVSKQGVCVKNVSPRYGVQPIILLGKTPVNYAPDWMEFVNDGKRKLHPSQKPDNVMGWLVNLATDEGQTVCDPFMGSGTTGVACARLKRNFIGIERDAAHYKTACDRIAHELDGALL